MKCGNFQTVGLMLVLSASALFASSVQAETTAPVKTAASAAVVKMAPARVTTGTVTPKVVVTPKGTITGKGGENQYPTGTIPIPPKPKKELLEHGAIKANVKAAQP